jgi:rubrerythrin
LSEETYKENIRKAYEGEMVAERAYGALAAERADPSQRAKLSAISRVEGLTHRRLQQVASRLRIGPEEARIKSTVERQIAELRQLTWDGFIQKAVLEWPAYLDRFAALRRSAAPGDEPALQYLVEHESALVQFAQLEHADPGSDSLRPLLAYLGELPA